MSSTVSFASSGGKRAGTPSPIFTVLHSVRHAPHAAIVLISILALGLRLWSLDGYGLWYDEVASIEIAGRGPLAILTDRFGGMLVQTPLHYLVVWLSALPVDAASSSILVRLPSVVAGALTPLVVYAIGKEMFGRTQGLVAALFITLSAVHISHSQDVRPYTLLILTTSLSVYTLLRAKRVGSAKWWAAFATSTVAALYLSYFSLTLFVPALVPYLAWVIYSVWSRSRQTSMMRRDVRYAAFALLAVIVASVPILLDVLRIQRNAPDLGLLASNPTALLDQLTLLFTSTLQLGFRGVTEIYLKWGLFMLIALGAYAAIKGRQFSALLLCLSMVIIPALLLAVAKTANPVFQRYAVFVMPFYFLLIANGAVRFWGLISAFLPRKGTQNHAITPAAETTIQTRKSAIRNLQFAVLPVAVALLLAAGVYIYFSPDGHSTFSYMPDYRGAARYLSRVAGPQDLIIMADEPGLGAEVINFYWRGAPPAPIFDARDPRLYTQTPKGTIFWVVSFFQNNPEFIRDLPASDPAWSDSTYFERIVVMRDTRHTVTLGMEQLVAQGQKLKSDFQPVRALQGALFQAQGNIRQAADLYRQAGAYFPQLGAEFFSSAQGFAQRGDTGKGWSEAITSLFMQPGNADLHTLMSQELLTFGQPQLARVEAEIADALRQK